MTTAKSIRSLVLSFLLHFGLVIFFFLFTRSQTDEPQETAIEITELIQSLKQAPKAQTPSMPKSSVRQATRPDALSNEPSSQTSNAPVAESESGGSALGESLAEEYEVSSLPIPLNEVRVPFPAGARERGAQGAVVFLLTISSEGKVVEAVSVTSPDPELTRVAREALLKFKFKPAILRDKAVAIKIRYTYRFVLQ